MRPHKLAITLVLLRAVRAAQIAAIVGGVFSCGHARGAPVAIVPPPLPADTTPRVLRAATTPPYVPPPPLEPRTIDGSLEGVQLFGDVAWAKWVLEGREGIVRSTDAGASWNQVGPRVDDSCGFGAHDEDDAFFVTCDQDANGNVVLNSTHDGGKTWMFEIIYERRGTSAHVAFEDAKHGTLVVWPYSYAEGITDHRSILFRTQDGGRSFTKVSEPGGNDIVFSDTSHAFVLGDVDANDEQLRWSSDGGRTFAVHPAFRACAVQTAPVFEGARGLLVARCPAGTFAFETSDAGASWKAGSHVPNENEGWFELADVHHGIFVEHDVMHVTVDGGSTWHDAPHMGGQVFWRGDALFAHRDAINVGALERIDSAGRSRTVATVDARGSVAYAFSGRTILAVIATEEGSLVYRSRDAGESFAVLTP
jgi:photosystem II stability/assembly factor-like uncharacterized protein